MDNPQKSPRFARYHGAQPVSASAVLGKPMVATHTPQKVPQLFGSTPQPAEIPDFRVRAKAYKKAFLKHRLFKVSIIAGIILAVIVLLLGSVGFVLNSKYSGRALPYTYVGEISIGGLTQEQIKSTLDKRAQNLNITLQEGGLTREVSASAIGVNFDTEYASKNAITGFNPFSYLNKRSIEVPVNVNPLTVDGYIRMQVTGMQTKNQNAKIVKNKNSFSVVPELNGFRTSSAYVVDQLKQQLSSMSDTTISLTAATDRPTVTAADLQDDLDVAKKLVSTKIAINANNNVVYPSEDQKFNWLEVVEATGASGASLQFSEAKIRAYVYELAQKQNSEPKNESIETKPDGSQYIKPGQNGKTVNNADDVAKQILNSLTAQQPAKIAFTFDEKAFNAVNRNGLILATATPKPAEDTNQPAATIAPISAQ